MAPACISIRAAAAPASIHAGSRRRPAAAATGPRAPLPTAAAPLLLAVPAFYTSAKRTAVLMRSSDSGEKNDDQLVSESGEILQGRQQTKTGPGAMSEDKRAQTPEQGGAPEGDRAIAGQAAQPTGEQQQGDMASPEAGEKVTGTQQQGASEMARQEETQQEERAPLQD